MIWTAEKKILVGLILICAIAGSAQAQTGTEEFENIPANDSEEDSTTAPLEDSATVVPLEDGEHEDVVVELPDEGLDVQLSLNMYGNVTGDVTLVEGSDEEIAFRLGALGTVFSGEVGSNVLALAEIAFEADDENQPVADVERVQLTYARQNYFVTAGRMHTEIGYWNTAFHHGLWLQLPIARPQVMAFEDEGGVLPMHFIGVNAGLVKPVGAGSLHLLGGIGNGRGNIADDVRVVNDTNNAKSVLLAINSRGLVAHDLRLGASAIYDRIAAASMEDRPALPGEEIEEVILNAHVVYTGRKTTMIAEFFDVYHEAESDSWNTLSAYALLGYDIGKLTPYGMFELALVGDEQDPFFVPDPMDPEAFLQEDFVQPLGGIRYRVGHGNVIKLEYRLRHSLESGGGNAHTAAIDWSFGI